MNLQISCSNGRRWDGKSSLRIVGLRSQFSSGEPCRVFKRRVPVGKDSWSAASCLQFQKRCTDLQYLSIYLTSIPEKDSD
jgi:hypothetical protein